jgi:hypothetical protein
MNENQKRVNEKYRSNYDDIFKKKTKDEQREQQERKDREQKRRTN